MTHTDSAGLIAELRRAHTGTWRYLCAEAATALEAAEARAVEAERRAQTEIDTRRTTERQLAAAREAMRGLLQCPALADGNHMEPAWYCEETVAAERAARAALSDAPAPVSGDEDDDKRECENCGKRAVFDTMHDVGDGAYICEPCYADWKKTFDACDHDWKPGEHDGYQGMYCEKCVGFMREEPAPAPVSGEDDETLTIIARSIGRTIREENHHQRARDVIRSLRERDMTLPTPAPSQNGGE